MKGSGQVTIKDIAKLAGVSFTTVSRTLNDNPHVAPGTRKKVLAIADELGFEFNSSARSLITSEVGTIGVILPEDFTSPIISMYHGMVLDNLRTRVEEADRDLIVSYQMNHYNGKNNIIRLVTRKKVDGLILLVEHISDESREFLQAKDFPFVAVHYPPQKEMKGTEVIYADQYTGGKLVAEHFLESGKRRFCLLSRDEKTLEFQQREQGFLETAARAGVSVVTVESFFDQQPAYESVMSNFDQVKQCDALFAGNDLMAIGAIRALREHGLRVPEAVTVVGYGDSHYARYFTPPLSSVHQPKEEIATLACDRLFSRIAARKKGVENPGKFISIQPELIIRDT